MPTNQPLSKQDWAAAVLAQVNSTAEGAQDLKDATQITEAESQLPAPKDAWDFLAWLRGDEPDDAFAEGKGTPDSAHDYASFLTTEWDLYGPEGE